MGEETKFCQPCKHVFAGMAYVLGRLRAYKVSSTISSIVTSGVLFKIVGSEELLKYAANTKNRCFGTNLEMITQFLLLAKSTAGKILLAYALSASLAGAYLSRHEWSEARELGAALIASIAVIVVVIALHVGTAKAIWICMP